MDYKDLIRQHGTQAALARALGVSRSLVNQWAKKQELPEIWQLRLEKKAREQAVA